MSSNLRPIHQNDGSIFWLTRRYLAQQQSITTLLAPKATNLATKHHPKGRL
uniref:Uncharacterized protein n=1 Tax=Arundo donax TaxID=35708 RepID=A0A0A9STN9_ARUDO